MKFEHRKDKILLLDDDGRVLATADFPEIKEGVVNVTHIQVSEALRGRGIAGKLMEELISQLKFEGRKAVLTCPYAIRWMESHPENAGILEKEQ